MSSKDTLSSASSSGGSSAWSVFSEVELGLIQEDPAARAALTEIKRTAEPSAQSGSGPRVTRGWSRPRPEIAIDDLGDKVLRHRFEVGKGGAAASLIGGMSHTQNVPRTGPTRKRHEPTGPLRREPRRGARVSV